VQINPEELSPKDRYRWITSAVIPRPIAFVSSLSPEGNLNLAPFSFFNGICTSPPVLAISMGKRKSGERKDSLRNIEETGEFVVNIVTEKIGKETERSSEDLPPESDEFSYTGLTPVPSTRVKPPRVAESPLSMECKLLQSTPIEKSSSTLILGEVISIHADEEILTEGIPDPNKLRPLGRLGGGTYAALGDLLEFPK
jgi:flavin reductase (DIM6/NTAB) family NADH-FMN oxidoreductase RutF